MEKFEKLVYSEIETKKISENESSFSLKPLERGFANTLGNAVRRVILSSVSGVAPFAVKVEGIDHEFQAITGVKEDAVQLVLNLKDIRFKYNPAVFAEGEVVKVSLENGTGEVTSKDLTLPAGVELVSNDMPIAQVAKTGKLNLEIFLIAGRGFKSFEENKETIKTLSTLMNTSISTGSFIAVDSDFSPVVNVAYTSEELNSSSAEIQEQLTLKVKTDGSIEAKTAIAQAAHILMSHLEVLSNVDNIQKDEIFQAAKVEVKEAPSEAISISTLDISVRSYNCLKRSNIETLDQLAEMTYSELENIQNLGKKSLEEILSVLNEHNIKLKGEK